MGELKVKTIKRNGCFFWHKWELIKDTGATKYYECAKCQSRALRQECDGYQPVDTEWVSGSKKDIT